MSIECKGTGVGYHRALMVARLSLALFSLSWINNPFPLYTHPIPPIPKTQEKEEEQEQEKYEEKVKTNKKKKETKYINIIP